MSRAIHTVNVMTIAYAQVTCNPGVCLHIPPNRDRPVRRVESKVGREPRPPGTAAFHLQARHLSPVSGVLERDAGSVAVNALEGLLFKRKWHVNSSH